MAELHEVRGGAGQMLEHGVCGYLCTYVLSMKKRVVMSLSALNYCLFECLHWHWVVILIFAFTIFK